MASAAKKDHTCNMTYRFELKDRQLCWNSMDEEAFPIWFDIVNYQLAWFGEFHGHFIEVAGKHDFISVERSDGRIMKYKVIKDQTAIYGMQWIETMPDDSSKNTPLSEGSIIFINWNNDQHWFYIPYSKREIWEVKVVRKVGCGCSDLIKVIKYKEN